MVVSIGEHCYVALARGGVTDFHLLIVPIDCVPNRLHLSAPSKAELGRYEESLVAMFMQLRVPAPAGRKHAGSSNSVESNYLCVKFERAIRTKGKDHMQYQLIPLPAPYFSHGATVHTTRELYRGAAAAGSTPKLIDTKAVSTFFQVISSYSLNFFELADTLEADGAAAAALNLDEVVINMEGGPYQEYFYVEIPCSYTVYRDHAVQQGVYFRRFLYVSSQTTDSKQIFPMHLGNEIAAHICEQPFKSNWKNCLLSEERETQIVSELKEMYIPHDFTNSS